MVWIQSPTREWIDPTFHLSPLLFCVIFHLATCLGMVAWVTTAHIATHSFLVLLLVTLFTMVFCYLLLFGVWQGTYKSDWYTLYNINVALARRFNDLRLLVNVVFSHPAGEAGAGGVTKVPRGAVGRTPGEGSTPQTVLH